MALIVKGNIPIGCKNCWFAELETGGRNFFCIKQIGKRFSVELAEQRQEGCPILGEIPDEHGDLADKRTIIERMGDAHDKLFDKVDSKALSECHIAFLKAVMYASTVLERTT